MPQAKAQLQDVLGFFVFSHQMAGGAELGYASIIECWRQMLQPLLWSW